jgi:hypothetical protein
LTPNSSSERGKKALRLVVLLPLIVRSCQMSNKTLEKVSYWILSHNNNNNNINKKINNS